MRLLSILAWTLATVAANPLPELESELEKRQSSCGTNNIAFRVLSSLGPRGSIFCNAFLNLPTSTTRTVLATPATTVTVPVTSITGPCAADFPQPGPEVERGQSGGGISGGDTAAAPAPEGKRDLEALEKRQAIPALSLLAARQITAGCSCLSLSPRTTVSTITPAATPVTVPGSVVTTCGPQPAVTS